MFPRFTRAGGPFAGLGKRWKKRAASSLTIYFVSATGSSRPMKMSFFGRWAAIQRKSLKRWLSCEVPGSLMSFRQRGINEVGEILLHLGMRNRVQIHHVT